MSRPAPLAEHREVFLPSGQTKCSCGQFTGTTYVGWKRHYKAERRKVDATAQKEVSE